MVPMTPLWSAVLCLAPPLALVALTVWISLRAQRRDLEAIRRNQAGGAYRTWNDPAAARQVQVLYWVELLSILGFVALMFRWYQTQQMAWFYGAIALGLPGVVASYILYRKLIAGRWF